MRIGQTSLRCGACAYLACFVALGRCRTVLENRTNRDSVGSKPVAWGEDLEPFVEGLGGFGWVEGQNITIERRYAAGNYEALTSLAGELVHLQPDVILAIGTLAARAAKAATTTIPIVFARTADPIGSGLVAPLARPGGISPG